MKSTIMWTTHQIKLMGFFTISIWLFLFYFSAKKSWFHCFIFGTDNDTSAPSIRFKLASPYLLHALAMAWEFTNATLRFLPSILHPHLTTLKLLKILHFQQFRSVKIMHYLQLKLHRNLFGFILYKRFNVFLVYFVAFL